MNLVASTWPDWPGTPIWKRFAQYNTDCVMIDDVGHLHRGGHVAVAELPSGVPVLHLDVLAEAAADI